MNNHFSVAVPRSLILRLVCGQHRGEEIYVPGKNRLLFSNLRESFLFDLPDSELEGVHLAEPLLVGQGGDVLAEALEGVVDTLHPPPLSHVGRVPHVHLADQPPGPAELPPHLLAVKVLRPEGVRGRVWKAGVRLTSGVASRVMRVRRVAGARAVVRVIETLLEREIFVEKKKF